MKTCIAMVLAALVVTPAFAGSGKKKVHRHHNTYNQMAPWDAPRGYNRNDPYEVRSYGGRRVIGRDPDPNIRRSLRDEDAFFRREP